MRRPSVTAATHAGCPVPPTKSPVAADTTTHANPNRPPPPPRAALPAPTGDLAFRLALAGLRHPRAPAPARALQTPRHVRVRRLQSAQQPFDLAPRHTRRVAHAEVLAPELIAGRRLRVKARRRRDVTRRLKGRGSKGVGSGFKRCRRRIE